KPNIDWKQQAQKVESEQEKAKEFTLEQIILDPKGKLSEKELIGLEWENLTNAIEQHQLKDEKEALMLQMAAPDFWSDDDRFDVMSDVEFIDRLLHSYGNLASLLDRISNADKPRLEYPANLLQRIADHLRLLKLALKAYTDNEYQECFLLIEANEEDTGKTDISMLFDQQVGMYEKWIRNRRMSVRYIRKSDAAHLHTTLLVTGFAARQLLSKESGLHIWETYHLKGGSKTKKNEQNLKTIRHRINVSCIPCKKPSDDMETLKKALKRQLKEQPAEERNLVRTYKLAPKTVVKDHVAGWQTTKIDQVLGGNFDLLS
ncbi:MAG: PCRF domain-containing protein, partial [Cyclobacteriaceae bacterium]